MECKRAVASTIYNNVNITKFAPWSRYRTATNPPSKWVIDIKKEIAEIIVDDLMENASWCECIELACCLLTPDYKPDGMWTHFYNPKTAKHCRWMDNLIDVKDIGNMRFGRL